MPRVIDAHLHLFSRDYFLALARQSPLPGTPEERLADLERRAGIEVPRSDLDAHVRRWLAELDRHHVERAVTFASAPEEAPAVAEAGRLSGGRLVPVALVNPRVHGAAERVGGLVSQGYRGVLLFPAMHGYAVGAPESRAVLDVLAPARALVFVQCGLLQVRVRDLLRLPRTTNLAFANPLDLVPVADAFPSLTFVVPHLGAGFLRETLMLGAQCANVVTDVSSSNAWLSTQVPPLTLADALAATLRVYGPQRILFGTDSSTFPRGWRSDVLAATESAFERLSLSPVDRARILHGNAATLLG